MTRRRRAALALLAASGAVLLALAALTRRSDRPHERAREFFRGYRVVDAAVIPTGGAGELTPMTVLATDRPYPAEVARAAATFRASEGWKRIPPPDPVFNHIQTFWYEPLLTIAGADPAKGCEILSLHPCPRRGGGCEFVVYWDRGTLRP